MNQNKVPNIEAAFAKVCRRKIKVTLQVASKQNTNNTAATTKPRESAIRATNFNNSITQEKEAIKPSGEREIRATVRETKPPVQSKVRSQFTPETKAQPEVISRSQDGVITPDNKTAVADLNPSSVAHSTVPQEDNFTKAVELVAQKFDGEIIDPKTPIANIERSTTAKPVSVSEQPKVVVRREATEYDLDDDDVPF